MKLKKITGLLTAIIIALSTFMVCGISVGAKSDDFANTVWEYDAAKVYGLTFTICKNEIKEGYTSAIFTFDADDYNNYVNALSLDSNSSLSANIYINDTYHIFAYFNGKPQRYVYGTIVNNTAVDPSSYEAIATMDDMGCPMIILSYSNDSDIAVELRKNALHLAVNYMGYIGNVGENLFCGDNQWYISTVTMDYDMVQSDIDISTLTFSKISNKGYTGKAIKPAVTVKDGSKKLVKGTDYTVSYKNNTKMGTATVTITGKGNYTGTKTLTFKIVPKKTSISIDEVSKSKAVLNWKKSSGAAGYEIWCSTNGESYTKLSTIKSAKTLTKTISKLNTQKNVYKFRVRPYAKVNGKTVYGSWSNIVSAG